MNDLMTNDATTTVTWKVCGKGMQVGTVGLSRRIILTSSRGTTGNNADGWRTRTFWHVTVDGRRIDEVHTLKVAKSIAVRVIAQGGPDAFFAKRAAWFAARDARLTAAAVGGAS